MKLVCGNRVVVFPRRSLVMGILNINDDSFCGDGSLDGDVLYQKARQMIADGADILDAGAESARTNREVIPVAEEIRRFELFEEIRASLWMDLPKAQPGQLWPPLVSLNVWRQATIRGWKRVKTDILNDMSGLPDRANAAFAAEHGLSLVIMHTRGEPKKKHTNVVYRDVVSEVGAFFKRKLGLAVRAGLAREAVILDVGFDFAKQQADNLRILRELPFFGRYGRPLLLPVSRKTMIGATLDLPNALDRDAGTVACVMAGAGRSGRIFRVHNVRAAWSVLRVREVMCGEAPPQEVEE